MKPKRAMVVIGLIILCLFAPVLFLILAVTLGIPVSLAVFIILGAVIVIRFLFKIDY